jgi:hypothetical protein
MVSLPAKELHYTILLNTSFLRRTIPAPALWKNLHCPWAPPGARPAIVELRQPSPGVLVGLKAGRVGQSQPSPKAIRVLRVKKPPTTPLVNRDSATRRARRLAVEFDVGDLCFALRSVRSREAVPAFIKSLAPSVLWLVCKVQELIQYANLQKKSVSAFAKRGEGTLPAVRNSSSFRKIRRASLPENKGSSSLTSLSGRCSPHSSLNMPM